MLIRTINYANFTVFKLDICNTLFKCYLHENEARKRNLAHPYFLYENESFQHCLSYEMRQMVMSLVFDVRFSKGSVFYRVRFFSGPGSGSGFRQC